MRSATDFLPCCMSPLVNLLMTRSAYFGSGRISRFSAARLRDICLAPSSDVLLRPLGAVLRAALPPSRDTLRIKRAADDVVAHAGQILHASAPDQHDRVLLKIVTLAGNVARHLVAVGQTYAGHLAQRRVRLLRRRRIDAGADTALLRRPRQRRHLVAQGWGRPRITDQLVDRRHTHLSRGRTPEAPLQILVLSAGTRRRS